MKRSGLSLAQQGLILISVPLLFEILFGLSFCLVLIQSRTLTEQEDHTERFISSFNNIETAIQTIAWAVRPRTDWKPTPADFAEANRMTKSIPVQLTKLKRLSISQLEKQSCQRLENNFRDFLRLRHDYLAEVSNSMSRGVGLEAFTHSPTAHNLGLRAEVIAERTNKEFQLDVTEQTKILDSIRKDLAFAASLKEILLYSSLLLHPLLILYLATGFYKSVVARLGILVQNTQQFAREMPLCAPLEGTDELALVDQNFHSMAAEVLTNARKERAIIEQSVDLVCSLDPFAPLRFQALNPAATVFFGVPANELMGKDLRDFLADGADRIPSLESIRREDPESFELTIKRKDGTVLDTLWTARWNETENAIFCVAADFTERKSEETMKQQIIAMLGDEFKTPLSSLASFYESLQSETFCELNYEEQSMCTRGRRQIQQMLWLVNDLLDLNRADAGKLSLNVETVNLHPLFTEVVSLVSGLATAKEISIEVKDTNLSLEADPSRCKQILLNFLSNAIKYSRKNTCITVGGKKIDATDSIRISVQDQGRGIDPSLISKMFSRFQQTKVQDRKVGTGIGLAICKSLVELHSGSIGVESKVGEGSTFWFTLPIKHSPPDISTSRLERNRNYEGEKKLCQV